MSKVRRKSYVFHMYVYVLVVIYMIYGNSEVTRMSILVVILHCKTRNRC